MGFTDGTIDRVATGVSHEPHVDLEREAVPMRLCDDSPCAINRRAASGRNVESICELWKVDRLERDVLDRKHGFKLSTCGCWAEHHLRSQHQGSGGTFDVQQAEVRMPTTHVDHRGDKLSGVG